ncbi:MAG: insulinase family protein [Porticoccaceae bacterium]|nr:insulinase family protein [Porticoccaceae bacterium]
MFVYRNLTAVVLLVLALLAGCTQSDDRDSEVTNPALESASRLSAYEDTAWFVRGDEEEHGDTAVYRSPADKRGYRYITLDNELAILLISDPETDKAAASLSVEVGSFDNPPEREGLAHFLEHMLFLGTDRYPEPGEYQAFISEHGGSHNAYTSLEETNYFFEVDAPHLEAALDRFSRFFVAPLFNPEFVERERNAVESEYRLRLKDDGRREWDVLRELASSEHPFSLFSVGNLETLADREEGPVRDDLLAFYQRYYSANLMTLAVLGREDLDTLEEVVRSRFAEVPNHGTELEADTDPLFNRAMPFRVSITPEKELRHLSVSFPMPSMAALWPTKPIDFISHLLGHEGEGTLLAELKSLGLAESLGAGLAFDSRAGAMFTVSIGLTEAGVEHHEAITSAFFDWLDLVRKQGLERWRYDEVANLSRVAFRFADKQGASRTVQRLSTLMHHYPAAETLRGSYLFNTFAPGVVEDVASHLRPDNAFVTLVARGLETDRTSTYYQTPYRVEPLDVELLSNNSKNNVLDGLALSLPAANEFIPEQLVLLDEADTLPQPQRLDLEESTAELWHYPDGQFRSPRAVFEARIAIPDLDDPRRETLLDLYRALVADQLSSRTYPAAQAGLGFNIGRWDNGLNLRVQGYSEKQPLLLDEIVTVMAAPDWDAARFDRIHNLMLRQWRNTARDWPVTQVMARLGPLLRDSWLPLEKAEILSTLTLDDVRAFAADLFDRSHARFYSGGNLDRDTAIDMAAAVDRQLGLGDGSGAAVAVTYKVHNLDTRSKLAVFPVYVDHEDSAALLFLQGEEDTLDERARFALLQKLTEAPFYSELRTERQLGYVVGNSISPMHRVPGLLFYVQSPGHDSELLQKEIDAFLERFESRLNELDEEGFERIRQAVLAGIEEQPKNVMELAGRHLESMQLGYNDFDFRPQLAAAIRTVSLDELHAAYSRVLRGDRQGLWVLSSRDPSYQALDRDARDTLTEGVFSYSQ